jgi:hypothetical protein
MELVEQGFGRRERLPQQMRHRAALGGAHCNLAETRDCDRAGVRNTAPDDPMNAAITLTISVLAALAIPLRVLAVALACLTALVLATGDVHAQAAVKSVALQSTSAAAPQAVVQALLQRHFKEDMGFTPASVARKAEWLTAGLQQRIAAGFAKPTPPGDAPDIDGDPFTNSQDPPSRFKVEAARVQADRAEVPVRFSGNGDSQRVRFILRLEQGAWRVDDVAYADGSSLRRLLP